MNKKGFFGLIGLLIAKAFISLLAYFVFVKYFGKPTGMNQDTQELAGTSLVSEVYQS